MKSMAPARTCEIMSGSLPSWLVGYTWRSTLPPVSHDVLQQAIVRGKLPPRTSLSEAAISSIIELSRTPVRTSLIEEARFVRSTLECANHVQLALSITGDQLAEFANIVERQRAVVASGQTDLFSELDELMHRRLFDFAGRHNTWAMLEPIKRQFDRVRWLLLGRVADHASRALQEHEQMLAQMAARDVAAWAQRGLAHQPHHRAPAGTAPAGARELLHRLSRPGVALKIEAIKIHRHLTGPQLRDGQGDHRPGRLRPWRRHAQRPRTGRQRLPRRARDPLTGGARPAQYRGHLAVSLSRRLLAAWSGHDDRHRGHRHGAVGHQGQAGRHAGVPVARRQEPPRADGVWPCTSLYLRHTPELFRKVRDAVGFEPHLLHGTFITDHVDERLALARGCGAEADEVINTLREALEQALARRGWKAARPSSTTRSATRRSWKRQCGLPRRRAASACWVSPPRRRRSRSRS